MRWQTATVAALALAACETNEATDLVNVTPAHLAGFYTLETIGGTPPRDLDEDFCITSGMSIGDDGFFQIRHHYDARVARGVDEPCSTAVDRFEFDVFWRGTIENTSTLVVMTIDESEFFYTDPDTTISEVTPQHTELVGEYNPNTGRLAVVFPDIWSFDPHGGSGGKISVGGDARGLGGGLLVFEQQ